MWILIVCPIFNQNAHRDFEIGLCHLSAQGHGLMPLAPEAPAQKADFITFWQQSRLPMSRFHER